MSTLIVVHNGPGMLGAWASIRWGGPLPDWLTPWVIATFALIFVAVVIWAVRQRRR